MLRLARAALEEITSFLVAKAFTFREAGLHSRALISGSPKTRNRREAHSLTEVFRLDVLSTPCKDFWQHCRASPEVIDTIASPVSAGASRKRRTPGCTPPAEEPIETIRKFSSACPPLFSIGSQEICERAAIMEAMAFSQ